MNMKRTSACGDWLILLYKTTFYVQETTASVADLASQNAVRHKKAPPPSRESLMDLYQSRGSLSSGIGSMMDSLNMRSDTEARTLPP